MVKKSSWRGCSWNFAGQVMESLEPTAPARKSTSMSLAKRKIKHVPHGRFRDEVVDPEGPLWIAGPFCLWSKKGAVEVVAFNVSGLASVRSSSMLFASCNLPRCSRQTLPYPFHHDDSRSVAPRSQTSSFPRPKPNQQSPLQESSHPPSTAS